MDIDRQRVESALLAAVKTRDAHLNELAAHLIVAGGKRLRPLLVLLTLPVTLVSLGLFVFVINAFLFWIAAELLTDFRVNSFGDALVGSLIYSALGMLIDSALKQLFPPK